MKSLKVLSLVLIATSLASGAVLAKGGGGMGNGGMGGGMNGAGSGTAQRAQDHVKTRTQTRTQSRDGTHANDGQRNENREQVRSEGAKAPAQQ